MKLTDNKNRAFVLHSASFPWLGCRNVKLFTHVPSVAPHPCSVVQVLFYLHFNIRKLDPKKAWWLTQGHTDCNDSTETQSQTIWLQQLERKGQSRNDWNERLPEKECGIWQMMLRGQTLNAQVCGGFSKWWVIRALKENLSRGRHSCLFFFLKEKNWRTKASICAASWTASLSEYSNFPCLKQLCS